MIYSAYFNPLIGVPQNRLEKFNEFSVVLITLHMFYFTDWLLGYDLKDVPEELLQPDKELLPNKRLQASYGIVMDCLLFFYLAVNISIILYFSLRSVKLVFTKYINLLKFHLFKKGIVVQENPKKISWDEKKEKYIKSLTKKEASRQREKDVVYYDKKEEKRQEKRHRKKLLTQELSVIREESKVD